MGLLGQVNGLRIKENNDGSAIISEDLGHLSRALGKVAENSVNHESRNI